MGLFGKKQDRDAIIAQGMADAEAEAAAGEGKSDNDLHTGNEKVDMELTKVYAQLDSFGEIRKANAERFTRVSEQLGELRGMIVDTNKAMSKMEVAATKAVDLVESVHPEKLMIEVRKQDGKIESLRANIEGNEAIVKDLMNEVKKLRESVGQFKGVDQVLKMNEEVKGELAEIKKMEATIERHADKVETIFIEVEKKFASFDKFDSIVKDLQAGMKRLEGDFDKMRVKLDTKEEKKEFVTLLDKFNNFETHTTNLLKLLDERSKTLKEELESSFSKLKAKLEKKLNTGPVDLDEPEKAATVEKKTLFKKFNPFGKKVVAQPLEGGEAEKPAENADSATPDAKADSEQPVASEQPSAPAGEGAPDGATTENAEGAEGEKPPENQEAPTTEGSEAATSEGSGPPPQENAQNPSA